MIHSGANHKYGVIAKEGDEEKFSNKKIEKVVGNDIISELDRVKAMGKDVLPVLTKEQHKMYKEMEKSGKLKDMGKMEIKEKTETKIETKGESLEDQAKSMSDTKDPPPGYPRVAMVAAGLPSTDSGFGGKLTSTSAGVTLSLPGSQDSGLTHASNEVKGISKALSREANFPEMGISINAIPGYSTFEMRNGFECNYEFILSPVTKTPYIKVKESSFGPVAAGGRASRDAWFTLCEELFYKYTKKFIGVELELDAIYNVQMVSSDKIGIDPRDVMKQPGIHNTTLLQIPNLVQALSADGIDNNAGNYNTRLVFLNNATRGATSTRNLLTVKRVFTGFPHEIDLIDLGDARWDYGIAAPHLMHAWLSQLNTPQFQLGSFAMYRLNETECYCWYDPDPTVFSLISNNIVTRPSIFEAMYGYVRNNYALNENDATSLNSKLTAAMNLSLTTASEAASILNKMRSEDVKKVFHRFLTVQLLNRLVRFNFSINVNEWDIRHYFDCILIMIIFAKHNFAYEMRLRIRNYLWKYTIQILGIGNFSAEQNAAMIANTILQPYPAINGSQSGQAGAMNIDNALTIGALSDFLNCWEVNGSPLKYPINDVDGNSGDGFVYSGGVDVEAVSFGYIFYRLELASRFYRSIRQVPTTSQTGNAGPALLKLIKYVLDKTELFYNMFRALDRNMRQLCITPLRQTSYDCYTFEDISTPLDSNLVDHDYDFYIVDLPSGAILPFLMLPVWVESMPVVPMHDFARYSLDVCRGFGEWAAWYAWYVDYYELNSDAFPPTNSFDGRDPRFSTKNAIQYANSHAEPKDTMKEWLSMIDVLTVQPERILANLRDIAAIGRQHPIYLCLNRCLVNIVQFRNMYGYASGLSFGLSTSLGTINNAFSTWVNDSIVDFSKPKYNFPQLTTLWGSAQIGGDFNSVISTGFIYDDIVSYTMCHDPTDLNKQVALRMDGPNTGMQVSRLEIPLWWQETMQFNDYNPLARASGTVQSMLNEDLQVIPIFRWEEGAYDVRPYQVLSKDIHLITKFEVMVRTI